jgi:hypothetical protein
MILFNGVKFASNDKEFNQSLFEKSGTCYGYYKKLKRGIRLFDHNKQIFAFIVNNGYGERFIVSATNTDHGIRCMHSTDSITDKLLGLDQVGYRQKIEECERIIKEEY